MKKSNLIILLLIMISGIIYAHGEGVHQYMVREAYKLLKNYVGQDVREMKDPVGYGEQENNVFDPGGKIVIGAYMEDKEEPKKVWAWFFSFHLPI